MFLDKIKAPGAIEVILVSLGFLTWISANVPIPDAFILLISNPADVDFEYGIVILVCVLMLVLYLH